MNIDHACLATKSLAQTSIVVFEDNDGYRNPLVRALKAEGFGCVHSARESGRAKRLIRSRDYDFYLLDMMGPTSDKLGAELSVIARGKNSSGYIRVYSALAEYKKIALESGANCFTPRPDSSRSLAKEMSTMAKSKFCTQGSRDDKFAFIYEAAKLLHDNPVLLDAVVKILGNEIPFINTNSASMMKLYGSTTEYISSLECSMSFYDELNGDVYE